MNKANYDLDLCLRIQSTLRSFTWIYSIFLFKIFYVVISCFSCNFVCYLLSTAGFPNFIISFAKLTSAEEKKEHALDWKGVK